MDLYTDHAAFETENVNIAVYISTCIIEQTVVKRL